MNLSRSNVRHRRRTALLIIDMLNTLDFPEGGRLLAQARPAARKIAKLKKRAKAAGVPVLYVNDNFGQWKSDRDRVFKKCSGKKSKGRELALQLPPEEDDYFVLKPRHSGFFSTTLEVLLQELGAKHLIVTGVAANICVLFTVQDAHVRGYELTVPRDCVASNSPALTRHALSEMKSIFKLKTPASVSVKME